MGAGNVHHFLHKSVLARQRPGGYYEKKGNPLLGLYLSAIEDVIAEQQSTEHFRIGTECFQQLPCEIRHAAYDLGTHVSLDDFS